MKFKVILTLVAALALAHCKTASEPEAVTDLKAETDDTPGDRTRPLVDISPKLEAHVNSVIAHARQAHKPADGWNENAKEDMLRKVYDMLGAYRPGTGIIAGFAGIGREVSLHPEVVYWLDHYLSVENNEILKLKFGETKYKDNVIGIFEGKVISHKSMEAANHSIAPILNVRGTILGTDKIGHFFMQGYWYWYAKLHSLRARCEYGQYMEGNPVLFEEKRRKYRRMAQEWVPNYRFGYFGSWSTGVISLADGEANERGYQFYKSLFDDPDGFVFTLADHDANLPLMNESINRSKYAHDINVADPPPDPNRPKDSCWKYDQTRYIAQ